MGKKSLYQIDFMKIKGMQKIGTKKTSGISVTTAFENDEIVDQTTGS